MPKIPQLVWGGLEWLAGHLNPDGGWGDTELSVSNISTTALGWAAFGAVPGADEQFRPLLAKVERWLLDRAGGLEPAQLAPAIIRRYGKDRTFSVPILTMCALAGRLGTGREAWRWVIPLPFELAACPPRWFAALRLPVVSYALPALIAIGQARHCHRPTAHPLLRWLRNTVKLRTLRLLKTIQPANGGFLEATPLTSFVVMSLAGSRLCHHPVAVKGAEFLCAAARSDGSWPIDTNLATWVTTLSVNALAPSGLAVLDAADHEHLRAWLLAQQYQAEHPYTHAPPGGWAWTDLPGGVPDADDTAGALLALRHLGARDDRDRAAGAAGIQWLLDLQNRDGGIPTFCRGWGTLPFDRSSADLTAHAMRAWVAWQDELPKAMQDRVGLALDKAMAFLVRTQRADGSWLPLWFGNQHAPNDENPTYGTAKVIVALADVVGNLGGAKSRAAINHPRSDLLAASLERGVRWLLSVRRTDGSWGGGVAGPASIEETALAVEALAAAWACSSSSQAGAADALRHGAVKGSEWLIAQMGSRHWPQPAPIGFYFAKLWYYERLYPLLYTVGALGRVARLLDGLCRSAPLTFAAGHPRAGVKTANNWRRRIRWWR